MSSGNTSPRKVAFASFIGTFIEWYDFFLYGTAASTVFEPLFFPSSDDFAGTLAAFATFAVGYAVRPLGAALFGQLGDRIGRKSVLVTTLLLMGIATFAIGLLPNYSAVGLAAPVLLVSLRLLQGLSVGGEWGGAALMTIEHSPAKRRGAYGSVVHLGAPAGLVLSTGMFTLFSSLPETSFLSWGWRIPFLFSGLLVGVGLIIRLRIGESPAFVEMKRTGTDVRQPLLQVLRRPRASLVVAALRFVEGVPSAIYAFFASTYVVTVLKLPANVGLIGVTIAAAVGLLAVYGSGVLSDRIGRRRAYLLAAVYSGVIAFPVFALMDTKVTGLIWLALVLGMSMGVYMVFGPQAALFAEVFSTNVRFSGASLGYQVGGALTSGLSPLAATAMLAATGGDSWPVALLIVGSAVVSLIALWLCPADAMSKEQNKPSTAAVDASEEQTR